MRLGKNNPAWRRESKYNNRLNNMSQYGLNVVGDWADERERSVLDTIYYCETCNIVMERADPEVTRHKKELPYHKMRRVMILRCGRCGNVVTDSYAEYSPERNQFWCKNCISDDHSAFHKDQ